MTLTNFQGSFNGLSFGPGLDVQVVSIEGLRAMPTLRSGDQAKPRLDGSYPGLNFLSERIVTVNLQVMVTYTQPFETVIANVANAFQNINNPASQLPFQFQLPSWPNAKQVICRPTRAAIPIDQDYSHHKTNFPVELTCSDPLVYDTIVQTATTGLPSPTAGLTFPVTFNATFGASTGGSMAVTNSGNYATAPVFTITGPCTNPSITFTSTGQFMQFNLALGPTDTLVVDMGARTATLNGTASRANTVVTGSSWFSIPPGSWTLGVASTDSAAVTAQFTCTWSSAWGWI